MAGSTTAQQPPQIATNQANKEAIANGNFNAAFPAMFGGLDVTNTSGLTWGYMGGWFAGAFVASGSVTLTASATNYLVANATTGAISVSTTAPGSGSILLYTIVTGAATVTSWTDNRQLIGATGSGGSVTSVGATGGVETDQPSNGAITSAGNVRTSVLLAGGGVKTAAYTFVTGDRAKALVMNSATAVSQTLPTPTSGVTSNFPVGWWVIAENIGAGAMTVGVPSGLSLDGVTNGTLVLNQNTGAEFFTDGTNWFSVRGAAAGGGGGMTNPMTTLGDIITGGAAGAPQRLAIGTTGQVLTVSGGVPAWVSAVTPAPAQTLMDFVTYLPGVPTASQVIMQAITPQPMTFAVGLSGSYANCDTAPTAAVTCVINRVVSGTATAIGSVNFAAGSKVGTFTFTSAVTTSAGDTFQVLAPATVDSTFAGPSLGIVATRAVGNPPLSGRNVVVDGNFDSWLSGTSFSVTPSAEIYTADMWLAYAGTGGAATVSQLAIAPETPPAWITTPRKYKLRFAQTTAASSAPNLMHRIEGVSRFSGRSITVSVSLVAAAAATLVTTVQVAQNFGSGGSPSATVYTNAPVTWNVGTTEARFSVRVDVPSIAGKTIGTNGDDQLVVAFILATGATFTLDFSQVQIEESPATSSGDTSGAGGYPTPFEYLGQTVEQARVNRYYERGPQRFNLVGQYAGGSVRFSVRKRAAPSMSYTDNAGNPAVVTTSKGDNQTLSAGSMTASSYPGSFESDAILTDTSPGNWVHFNWVADARL